MSPERWIVAAVVPAWLGVYFLTGLQGRASYALPVNGSLLTHVGVEFGICLVMPIAMMLPFAATQIRLVAFSSYAHRRWRAMSAFTRGFVGVWFLAMTVIMTWLHLVLPLLGPIGTLAVTCVCATIWQALRVRRIALRRCAFTTSLRADPSVADQDCARFGGTIAWASVVACAGFMAIAMAGGSFAAIALVVPVQCYDGLHRHPNVRASCIAVGCIGAIELALAAARG